jgi:hypothetical protein
MSKVMSLQAPISLIISEVQELLCPLRSERRRERVGL